MGGAFPLGQSAAGQLHRVAHAGIDLFLNGPVSDPANGHGRLLRDCGMKTTPEDYREQIEDWKDSVCEVVFGGDNAHDGPHLSG